MAAVAAALRALTGPWRAAVTTLTHATSVAAERPEEVVLAAAGLLAWTVWAWGALGLLLTAASAAPGLGGAIARGLSRLVLPASLRTASGLALGVGLVVTAPAAAAAPGGAPPAVAVAVADWPTGNPRPAAPGPPDWPTAAPAAAHVVAPGDSLWRIAEAALAGTGSPPTDAAVLRAVDRWWSVNAAVIGPDPDLIRPGQALLPPPGADAPPSTADPHRSTP
jgi:hypothetical protein